MFDLAIELTTISRRQVGDSRADDRCRPSDRRAPQCAAAFFVAFDRLFARLGMARVDLYDG